MNLEFSLAYCAVLLIFSLSLNSNPKCNKCKQHFFIHRCGKSISIRASDCEFSRDLFISTPVKDSGYENTK